MTLPIHLLIATARGSLEARRLFATNPDATASGAEPTWRP